MTTEQITATVFAFLLCLNMNAMEIEINVNGRTFTAEVEDSETGRAFCALLPMTLEMSELNGNEKYHYLMNGLPTNAQYYNTINAGDLMLYGSACVVLFYGNAGGYSYTRLGRLTSTQGLAEAVGSGNVSVTFSVKSTALESIPNASANNDKIYDITGRELSEEPARGIFIRNGKKIVKQ